MQTDKKFNIASPEAVRNRIDELRYRSDDIKGRLAQTLINLWEPERPIRDIGPLTDFSHLKSHFLNFNEVMESVDNSIFVSNLTSSLLSMAPSAKRTL